MPSVTNTGTCLRPSCTAIVWPSMSGMIVDRRDQVLMTFLVPRPFCASTFLSRWSSTNAPFFTLRGIRCLLSFCSVGGGWCECGAGAGGAHALALPSRLATTDDHPVARLVPRPGATLGLTGRVHRVAATGGLALTTAVRVVHRVHGNATDGRTLPLPAHTAGLAPVDARLLGVTDLADRGATALVDVADLAGGHPEQGHALVLRDQLNAGAGTPGDLRAA